jgi:hypothetical protein
VLFLSHDDRPPAEAPPQGSEDRRLRGDALYSLDPATGAASKLWSTFDLLDPTDRPPNTRDPLEDGIDDWTHANSLSFGPRRNLIISLRQLDQVISLSPDLSRVEWRLGGPGSSFTFTDSDDRFYRQHSATELPGWRLLVFDNGRNRPEGEFSRALELELDVPTMTARKVWEYRHIPDVYASRMSSALRLGNGGTLVNFGWRTEPDEPALLVEAGQDGGVISSQWLWMKGARTSRYRALAIDSLAGEIEVSPTTSTGC